MSERLRVAYLKKDQKRVQDAVHKLPNNALSRENMKKAGDAFKLRHPEIFGEKAK